MPSQPAAHGASLRRARNGGNRGGYARRVRYQFVDCRWALDDPAWGREQYVAGHVPGASFLDVERDLSAPPGPAGRHPLPSGDDFAAAAAAAGIGAGVFVVAYGSLGGAERLWWLLRHFGHDACGVIEADAWPGQSFSGKVSTVGTAAEFTPRNIQTRTDRDRLVFPIEVSIPNPGHALRPGMPVQITLPGTER